MKRLILAGMLALSGAAHAVELIASAPNRAGGEIMIYGAQCADGSGLTTVGVGSGGDILITGCASALNDTQIVVWWMNGDASIFKNTDLRWTPYVPKEKSKAQPSKRFAY